MRLVEDQIVAIKHAATEAFGARAVVRLFGSRVDDAKRGGDIDLHVEAPAAAATVDNEIRFRTALWRVLDEPQIDVVIHSAGTPLRWIDRAAWRSGVVL